VFRLFSAFLVEFALEKMVVDIEIARGDPSLAFTFSRVDSECLGLLDAVASEISTTSYLMINASFIDVSTQMDVSIPRK